MTGYLANLIRDAIDSKTDDLISCLIYGERRTGKTSYALKTAYEIYGSWDQVLDHVFFDVLEFCDKIDELLDERKSAPVMIFDDAGVHAGNGLYFSDREAYNRLTGVLDTIGIITDSLLWTAPSPDSVVNVIENYQGYIAKIVLADSEYQRLAKGYDSNMIPSGKSYISTVWEDTFSCRLPDQVYSEYSEIRREYLRVANEKLRESGEGG